MKLINGDMIGEIEFLMEKGKELKKKKSKYKSLTNTNKNRRSDVFITDKDEQSKNTE